MNRDFLLEIGTEEIPARFIPPALKLLGELAGRLFDDKAIGRGEIRTVGTPRRLAVIVSDVATEQLDRTREVSGPPAKAAFTPDGRPTKAAEGFAKSQGVDLSALQIRDTEKGQYVFAVIHEKGRPVAEVLPEIAAALVNGLSFPKSMRWGSGAFRFARPVHWFVSLYGSDVVPFELDGLKSGRTTRGHRFLSTGEISISDPASYVSSLMDHHVMVDPAERAKRIDAEVQSMATARGGRIIRDEGLLETVSNLVEWPVPVLGTFEEKYLALPKELLVTVMRDHQKYFALEDASGRLLPNFITISNSSPDNAANVAAGNERVLRARLEDARFYFEDDQTQTLESRLEALKKVTYQEKLGSVYEKIDRVERIALAINGKLKLAADDDVRRAARLAKADLSTGVVYEFPELQGIMGRTYAAIEGITPAVCQAIEEHYRPRFSGDDVPASDLGAIVSLADKIDSVVAFFSVGLIPTGSEDPFALRRQSLGIIAILDKKGYDFGPADLMDLAITVLSSSRPIEPSLRTAVMDFFGQRLQVVLSSEGQRYDDIAAATATPYRSIGEVRARLAALARLRPSPDFAALVIGAKRVYNIIAKIASFAALSEAHLKEPAERALFESVVALENEVSVSNPEALNRIVGPVNTFFDAVLVMDKDEAVKNNRLALLERTRALFNRVADFSKIVE